MATSRHSRRRGTEAVATSSGTARDALSPRRLALGEGTEQAPGEPGEPAGFGTEVSTTVTAVAEVDSYQVPMGRTGRLIEAALSIDTNGEASVHVNGIQYGPFTGELEVTLPFDGAYLPEGAGVKVTHRSPGGASTTTRASVTVKEV